jgi:hypothetical protein
MTEICLAAPVGGLYYSLRMRSQAVGSTCQTGVVSAACCCAGDEAAAAAQQAALEAAALALHEEQQPNYWTDYLQASLTGVVLHRAAAFLRQQGPAVIS